MGAVVDMQSNNNFYIKTKTLINPRCLLRALRLIRCRLPCPFESELSTVTTSVSRWWRPMLPPRKRHRAINRDKPKTDDFPADISPLSFSPEGEMQVTPNIDILLIVRHSRVSVPPLRGRLGGG